MPPSWHNYTIDLIWPKACLVCQRPNFWLCDFCEKRIRQASEQYCAECQKPSPNGFTHPKCGKRYSLDGLLGVGLFSQLQDLIHALKYEGVQELAQTLGRLYLNYLEANGLTKYFSQFTIVPVPLHPRRYKFRGYNQSELLAQTFSQNLGGGVAANIIERTKNTQAQIELDKSTRSQNMTDAFITSSPHLAVGKNILLIDDIATTGATLKECATVLKRAGAAKVWAMVLAHA